MTGTSEDRDPRATTAKETAGPPGSSEPGAVPAAHRAGRRPVARTEEHPSAARTGAAVVAAAGAEQPEREAGVQQGEGGPVVPVDGGVPGPQSEAAARMWGATYGAEPGSGTDYEGTRQSTEAIRRSHRVARGPGSPRQGTEGEGGR